MIFSVNVGLKRTSPGNGRVFLFIAALLRPSAPAANVKQLTPLKGPAHDE